MISLWTFAIFLFVFSFYFMNEEKVVTLVMIGVTNYNLLMLLSMFTRTKWKKSVK